MLRYFTLDMSTKLQHKSSVPNNDLNGTRYNVLLRNFPHKLPQEARYHDAANDICYNTAQRTCQQKYTTKARYHDAIDATCYATLHST